MTLEEKIQVIINKFKTNEKLTKEDEIIIEHFDSLKVELAKAYLNGRNYFEAESALIEKCLYGVDGLLEEERLELFEKYVDKAFEDMKYFSLQFDDSIFSELNIPNELKEKIQTKLKKIMLDPNAKFEDVYANDENIIYLLDTHNYELLSKMSIYRYNYVSEEVLDRLEKEFPKDKYPFPKIYILKKCYSLETDYSKLSMEEIFEFLYKIRTITFYQDYFGYDSVHYYIEPEVELYLSENAIEISYKAYEAIIHKISSTKDLSFLENKDYSGFVAEYFKQKNVDALKLLSKNYLTAYKTIEDKSIVDSSLLYKVIKHYNDNNIPIPENVIDVLSPEMMANQELVNLLIQNGIAMTFINSFAELEDKTIEEDITEKIMNEIKNGNERISNDFKTINYRVLQNQSLLDFLLENVAITTIDLTDSPSKAEEREIINNNVIKVLEKYPDVNIKELDLMIHLPVIRHLYKMERYEDVVKALSIASFPPEYEPECIDMIRHMVDNYYIANLLLDNVMQILVDYDDIIDKYLSNEVTIKLLLDTIANSPDYIKSLCVEKNYQIVKHQLTKMYKIPLENLDKIEKKYGPNIIVYLNNENILDLLRLQPKDLDKVLSIFPDKEYTMVDVEAAYISIIEVQFQKDNPDAIDMFSTYMHHLEDKQSTINEEVFFIKNTSFEHIIAINKKYKLNIEDTRQLLDYINKTYLKDQSKALDILHDLADLVLKSLRSDYVNYHMLFNNRLVNTEAFNGMLACLNAEDGLLYFENSYKDIFAELDKGFYKRISKYINITPEDMEVKRLYELTSNPKTRYKYLLVVKEAIKYYYEKKADKYQNAISIGAELDLQYEFEKTNLKTVFENYCIIHSDYFEYDRISLYEYIIEKAIESGIEEETAYDCMSLYNGRGIKEEDRLLKAKKKIRDFLKIAREIINTGEDKITYCGYRNIKTPLKFAKDKIIKDMDTEYLLRRQYSVKPGEIDMYKVLMNIFPKRLLKGMQENPELYNKLIQLFQKRKLHLLPIEVINFIQKCDIDFSLEDLSSFINYFATIDTMYRKKQISKNQNPDEMMSILDAIRYTVTFAGTSGIYSQILTPEDARLIKSKDTFQASDSINANDSRLAEAVRVTAEAYQRKNVTVPTFDENITINGKAINVIVGNFTAPCNMTHGERTDACMRINGAADSLFHFAIENDNGFHIRFEDPETHEYVSRITCFRNGNTLFLNQLRHSLSEKYTDEELVEYTYELAKKFIELTKDSKAPIENVLIHYKYGFEANNRPRSNIPAISPTKGYDSIYTDIKAGETFVLATTSQTEEMTPFIPCNENMPTYPTCRGKVRYLKNYSELLVNFERIASIKQLLEGVDYKEIDTPALPQDIIFAIVSDDWYIFVNKDMELLYDFIPEDPRAEEELKKYLLVVQEKVANKEIEQTIGSEEHGLI